MRIVWENVYEVSWFCITPEGGGRSTNHVVAKNLDAAMQVVSTQYGNHSGFEITSAKYLFQSMRIEND